MDIDAILERARAGMSAERVFGTPVEQDGVTVIPAAKVMGGGGGGTGTDDETGEEGGGAGFGINARPVGALIIEPGGTVRWKPCLDWNRVVVAAQLVGIAFFASVWFIKRSEARAAMKAAIATAAGERSCHR